LLPLYRRKRANSMTNNGKWIKPKWVHAINNGPGYTLTQGLGLHTACI
jgi:hypothetical protein